MPVPLSFHTNHVPSEPDDYRGREFPVFFPAGATKTNFGFPIVNDDIFELDENFFITLEIPQPATNIGIMRGEPVQATVTIRDDEGECVLQRTHSTTQLISLTITHSCYYYYILVSTFIHRHMRVQNIIVHTIFQNLQASKYCTYNR